MTIYLYVKQHCDTRLKYFGMTRQSNPIRYRGSGKYWASHLKKHGRNVETIQLWQFEDQESCTKFAIDFSHQNNIVKSSEWANLSIEDGKYGGGQRSIPLSEERKKKISIALRKNNRKLTEEHKQIISNTHKNKIMSQETRRKLAEHNLGKKWTDEEKMKFSEIRSGGKLKRNAYTCPHCSKTGYGPNMFRYHFDKCPQS